jgi:hypothetical protein
VASRAPLPAFEPEDGNHAGVQPPVTAQAFGGQFQTALEKDFPRILAAIQSMWGYPELNNYFRKLTLDSRGDREGFPKEVWEEIFTLLYLHQMIVPESLY